MPPFKVMNVSIVEVPRVTLGAEASAWSQKETQDVQTNKIEGKK